MNNTSHKSPYYKSTSRRVKPHARKGNADYVNAIHFNRNGKKLCVVVAINPQHTTDEAQVTCRYCKLRLGIRS